MSKGLTKGAAALPRKPSGAARLFLILLSFLDQLYFRIEVWFWWFVSLAISVVSCISAGRINFLESMMPSRLPVHIAIVIEEKNVETFYASGCRLVRWCLQLAGVRYITLYSSTWGKDDLAPTANLAAKRVGDMGLSAVAYAGGRFVGEYNSEAGKAPHVICTVGQAEGREALANAARSLHDLSEEKVGRLLPTAAGGAPDPELMLVFGKADSVYGFPPWPLAVTELRFHRSLRHFTKAELLRDLRHYASVKSVKGV